MSAERRALSAEGDSTARCALRHAVASLGFLTTVSGAQEASVNAAGAAVRFTPLTVVRALSDRSVFVVLQDRHGFLWAGTNEGLTRFDG